MEILNYNFNYESPDLSKENIKRLYDILMEEYEKSLSRFGIKIGDKIKYKMYGIEYEGIVIAPFDNPFENIPQKDYNNIYSNFQHFFDYYKLDKYLYVISNGMKIATFPSTLL